MYISDQQDLAQAIRDGLLQLGEGAIIEDHVEICHPTRTGEQKSVVIGKHCHVRSGTILYSGIQLGNHCQTGHHVVIRENTRIGHHSVIGTGVKVEMNTEIGNHVMIETQSHITAYMTIEDYAFVGPGCVMTNDSRMLWRRAGAGAFLEGPTLRYACRVGGGSVILPGIVVGREAIVAAGSVVARDVPDRTVAGGNPVRLLGPVPDDEPVVIEE